MNESARAAVRARELLAQVSDSDLREPLILLDRWLAKQPDRVKRDLARYFGIDNLPVSARPDSNQDSEQEHDLP